MTHTIPSQNKLIQTLLLRKSPIGHLSFFDPADGPLLAEVVKKIQTREVLGNQLFFTTGIGLDRHIPLRLPAIVTPALSVMKGFHDMDLEIPHYIIYQARNFIAQVNKMSPNRMDSISEQQEKFLKSYVSRFFPEIEEAVHFHFGEEADIDVHSPELLKLAQGIRDKCEQGSFHATRETLEGYRKNRLGNDPVEYLYAAANVFTSGAVGGDYLALGDYNPQPRILFPIGGIPEKPFFQLIRSYASERNNSYSVIPLLTQTSTIPSYHVSQRGDIVCSGNSTKVQTHLPYHVMKDFQLLDNAGISKDSLLQVYLQSSNISL